MQGLFKLARMLSQKRLRLIDGDGTLYNGDSPTKCAREFLRLLDKKRQNYMMITNNSSYSRKQHAKRISRILKRKIRADKILVSTQVTIKYLVDNGVFAVYALGVPSFRQELRVSGIKLTSSNP